MKISNFLTPTGESKNFTTSMKIIDEKTIQNEFLKSFDEIKPIKPEDHPPVKCKFIEINEDCL